MILSLDKEHTSNNSEKKLGKKCFFGDEKGNFIIKKANFPENTLVYCNQGTISTLKAGDYAIYIDYVIFGQLIFSNNSPELDNFRLKENEVILYMPLYKFENGYFRDVEKWLAYVLIWEKAEKTFFSYGYNEERS